MTSYNKQITLSKHKVIACTVNYRFIWECIDKDTSFLYRDRKFVWDIDRRIWPTDHGNVRIEGRKDVFLLIPFVRANVGSSIVIPSYFAGRSTLDNVPISQVYLSVYVRSLQGAVYFSWRSFRKKNSVRLRQSMYDLYYEKTIRLMLFTDYEKKRLEGR